MDMASLLALQTAEHLATLRQAQGQSPDAFVLSHSKQRDWPLAAMAEQLACRKKLKTKLPDWAEHDVLMSGEMFEQSSSAWCAAYKLHFCAQEQMRILDICAGLGVDAMAFAAAGHQVVYNDSDPLKAALCEWNAQQLGVRFEAVQSLDAAALLNSCTEKSFDLICADPSRRAASGKRVNKLEDCQPQILSLMPQLRIVSHFVLLKLAPSMSVAYLSEQLPGIERIVFVSLDGEMKECLVWINCASSDTQPQLQAVCLHRQKPMRCLSAVADDAACAALHLEPAMYVYDPDPALLHAQALPALLGEYELGLLSASHPRLQQANAALFAAAAYYEDFPGRVFQVIAVMPYNRKQCRKYVQANELKHVHVWRCQAKQSVAALRKDLGLRDGHEASILIYADAEGHEYFVHGVRVESA